MIHYMFLCKSFDSHDGKNHSNHFDNLFCKYNRILLMLLYSLMVANLKSPYLSQVMLLSLLS